MYVEREQDVLRAASMYYLQDLKMEVIARHLGTSRSTVSRLIKRARQTGLVEITLRPASTRAPGLGRTIAAAFGIDAYVVPVPDSASHIERLDQVVASPRPGCFARGSTPTWCSASRGAPRSRVGVPVPGAQADARLAPSSSSTAPRTCAPAASSTPATSSRRFGTAFGAAVHHFSVPAFFDYPDTKAAMWRERSVRRVLDVQRRADIAVFSVGAVAGAVPSHVYSAGYLDDDDVSTLHDEGVVGDVCTVFLRADGSLAGRAPQRARHRPDPRRAAADPAPGVRRGRATTRSCRCSPRCAPAS